MEISNETGQISKSGRVRREDNGRSRVSRHKEIALLANSNDLRQSPRTVFKYANKRAVMRAIQAGEGQAHKACFVDEGRYRDARSTVYGLEKLEAN